MPRPAKTKAATPNKIYFPFLRDLTIEQFRSLYDINLSLKPLNIFIGANASGKSNLFKALRVMRDMTIRDFYRSNLQEELANSFWYQYRQENPNKNPRLRIKLHTEVPEQIGDKGVDYTLTVMSLVSDFAIREELVQFQSTFQETFKSIIKREGAKGTRYLYPHGEEIPIRELRYNVSVLDAYTAEETYPQIQALYDFIKGLRYFRFTVEGIRNSVVGISDFPDVPVLTEDGSNLSSFLYALHQHNQDAFTEIEERLERAIRFPSAIETHYAPSIAGNGKAQLMFHEHPFGERDIPAESMSDGTLRLLALYAALIGDESSSLICLEEPDQGLHPRLMLRLADTLRSVVDISPEDAEAGAHRPQILLTTHSTDLLDCFNLEAEKEYLQIFVVERNEEDGKTEIRPVDATNLAHWLNEYRLGDLVRRGVIS